MALKERRSLRGSVDWNHESKFDEEHAKKSLPSWECGLKYFLLGRDSSQKRSLPSWECGLKLVLNVIYMKSCDVAPFVGVWIEIYNNSYKRNNESSRSLRGSVDWNFHNYTTTTTNIVAPFVGVWIEMIINLPSVTSQNCRSLRGSVDWNYNNFYNSASDLPSLPSWECGLKSELARLPTGHNLSLPSWECGLKLYTAQ